jgi:ATP-binding cassette subfamily B protein
MMGVGATFVMKGEITLGALMTFSSLSQMFSSPISNLVGLQVQIQEANIAMKRLTEIYDVDEEQTAPSLREEVKLKGNILYNNVTFRYGSRSPIIKNLSFSIPQGQKIAIVGESGSGKTTIAKLLLGLYEPEEGEIRIGNDNIKNYEYASIRKRVAYVNQNVELFSGSIIDNIKKVNPQISLDKIKTVCQLANCDFINRLPNGYETFLEEAGANLSGGERQKLAIARSLAKDFDILVFDEATSNLDFVSELKIYHNVLNNNFSQTMIFIAHRLTSIKKCDTIFFVHGGRIIEYGTHEQLMLKQGHYYRMWQFQQGNVVFKETKKSEEPSISKGEEISYG